MEVDQPIFSYRTWSKQMTFVARSPYDGSASWHQFLDNPSTLGGRKCRYCGCSLQKFEAEPVFHRTTQFVFHCLACGWWKIVRFVDESSPTETIYGAKSSLRKFRVEDLDVPITDLRRFLAQRPNFVRDVDPYQFEKLVQDCLRSAYPDAEIHHVGGTSDGGVDIKMVSANNRTYLVQVKRRQRPDATEGVQVVRELNGVLFRKGETRGMVVTTAKRFTAGAHDEAMVATKTEEPYEMKLIAFSELVEMLRLPHGDASTPWTELLTRTDADFGEASSPQG